MSRLILEPLEGKAKASTAQAEARLAMAQNTTPTAGSSMVDLSQLPGTWPEVSLENSIHSHYVDRNASESAGAAATLVNYSQNGDFELEDTMMQQAFDEW